MAIRQITDRRRGPTRIASTHTADLPFKAMVYIEALAADGISRQRHGFTTAPIDNLADLVAVMHRAGDEARRMEVESVCR